VSSRMPGYLPNYHPAHNKERNMLGRSCAKLRLSLAGQLAILG
jgi:hypothetical protein